MWNARSQAANQGYSHLSGMEMTSSVAMWNQWLFRTEGAAPASGSAPRSMSQW